MAMGTDWELVLGELGRVGNGAGIRNGGLLILQKQKLCPIQEWAVSRRQESVESHLVEAFGQNVQEIATDEFIGGKGHCLPGVVTRVFVAKSHVAGLH
jgi:hypothetical protein